MVTDEQVQERRVTLSWRGQTEDEERVCGRQCLTSDMRAEGLGMEVF